MTDARPRRAVDVPARRTLVAALLAGLVLATATRAADPGWQSLFDGTSLGEWEATPFGGGAEPQVVEDAIRIEPGADLNGVTWQGEFPRSDYELALEARRVDGNDFFCGLTFPVGETCCSLILGGWGGGVVGLSCLDGADASENPTTQYREFERGRWYDVVVRVTPERIECLLDGETIVDEATAGRRISVRHEVALSKPLGIATYATTGEVRNIRWRPHAVAADAGAKR